MTSGWDKGWASRRKGLTQRQLDRHPDDRRIKRKPMKRSRKPVNPVSKQQRAKNERRSPVRAAQLAAYPFCEAAQDGAPWLIPYPTGGRSPTQCFGPLECHEPWPRGRGGPIDDPNNFRTVCAAHNTAISQEARIMAWAKRNDYLISAAAGPAWLEAGGVQR